jgi:osmotically inducible lipoprotein OsmB
VKRVPAFVPALLALAAMTVGSMGCTTTQKVVSGAAVGGGTGLLLAGPVGAAAGAAIGAVAAPVGSAVVSAD